MFNYKYQEILNEELSDSTPYNPLEDEVYDDGEELYTEELYDGDEEDYPYEDYDDSHEDDDYHRPACLCTIRESCSICSPSFDDGPLI